MHVLVTGATGYIGGRLVRQLLDRGYKVRVLVRDPGRIVGRSWADRVGVLRGDLLAPNTLEGAFEGIDTAYYLVHSMQAGKGFAQRDRQAAENFCCAAGRLKHVIYLGGLVPEGTRISKHLQSRAEIGEILARHLPTTELRAGPIIGSGSASFEIVRYMAERLPMMVVPRWVLNEIQPIAVRDALLYLLAALERGPSGVVEVGTHPLSYKQMIQLYARERGLRRLIISVPPFLPPFLGASLIGLVTPIPRTIAVPLVEGMFQPLLVRNGRAREVFPEVVPITYQKAVVQALRRIREQAVETRWSSALANAPDYEHRDRKGLVREVRSLHLKATSEAVFKVFSGLGGERGWLVWNRAWTARGLIDQLVGGPGLRRGRRDPDELLPGETVDFWRVEAVRAPHLLRLRGEVKLPGLAWLEWKTAPEAEGTRLTQTVAFAPRGLTGALYWYLLYPFHRLIFNDMLDAIGRAAESAEPTP